MANLADVFTDSKRTNWLKAWLAIDIAKSGLEQFAENEAKILQGSIYNAILTSGAVACKGCHTGNLLKCPSPGICNKRGANSLCKSMHDNLSKLPRTCPANVCNKVLIEIAKQHKFSTPSWKNTEAIQWSSCPWQIAKAYLPPDGYTGKSSAQDTDFNGIISFMMNCKHFDNKFSFPIAPGKTHPPCLLTKARDICKNVRHSSTCKVIDRDLQDIFITLNSLLTDQQCLANDVAAQEAVRKLAKLQTDVLKLTTEEIVTLLEAAQDKLKKVEHTTETAIMKYKQELDEHTDKCKEQLDEHRRKTTEIDYDQSCKDFRRRLMTHYDDICSNVPLSNMDQSLDKRIEYIYAKPNIHRIKIANDGKRIKQGQVLTYKEIFYTDDKSNRRIYLQGEPGSGKSTFSAKLVYDWSHINQVSSASHSSSDATAFADFFKIQQFKFLFFVTLRHSRGQTDVTQMIQKQLIDTIFSEDERADVYKLFEQIIKTEICLVIREGLDEWVPTNGSSLAEPSMAGFQTDMCSVLTTSRPWKLADERIKNSQIDSLFEIEGISDPYEFSKNIIRCLIDQSKDPEETAIQFESFVENRKLESLSSSPMLYTLVICTWVNTIEEEEHLEESSLCALYTSLLESLCKKANSTTGYFNDSNPPPVRCFSSTRYIQPNIEHLDKLAEVACKLLFSPERESSIVFSDIILSNCFSPGEFTVRKTFALEAGILTSRKDNTRTGSSNSFVHKTVQELLAAYHIACNTHIIDDVISRYLKLNNTSYFELSQVLIFLYGMNTFAANKLSALMNQYDVIRYNEYNYMDSDWDEYDTPGDECDEYDIRYFQHIIASGIREAAANKLEGIQLKLNNFDIDESNIRELWPTDTCHVHSLRVRLTGNDFLSSSTRDASTSHFEFNLSSCHSLRALLLSGSGILLRDTESSVRSEFPVCMLLNNADPAQVADNPIMMSPIQYISLKHLTCSSTCLRSLLSMLLTLDHEVECTLECVIHVASSAEESDICTEAYISTNKYDEFVMHSLKNDSPGLWEALHGLNIKSLSLGDHSNRLHVDLEELFLQCLSSLTHLDTLSIDMDCDCSSLCKALHGMNITTLDLNVWCSGLRVKHVKSMSQSLSSLIHLETLSIGVDEDSPGLWKALSGLNIKILNLNEGCRALRVKHVKSMSQSLSSLIRMETLSIHVDEDSPGLWKALSGLNIKRLRLNEWERGLRVKHVESMSQSLSSLIRMEQLGISVAEDSPGLWEALRGLKIKSLSLHEWCRRLGLRVKHVESMSQSLSSLMRMDTLSISVDEDSPCLFEFLRGLNIKSLSLMGRWRRDVIMNHVESLSQSLSSLTQLETLNIGMEEDSSGLWEAIRGLNIKTLNLSRFMDFDRFRLQHVDSMSQSLSSLKRLDTLSIEVDEESPGLWEVLRGLNIKSLTLSGKCCQGLIMNHVESISKSLSSLTQLETLNVSVAEDRPGLWEALRGLNIKSLSLISSLSLDLTMNHVESLSQSLSSLTQLETLSIQVDKDSPGLWKALSGLNIKTLNLCDTLRSMKRKHVDSMSKSLSSLIRMDTLSIEVYDDSPGLWKALSGLNIKRLRLSGLFSRGLIVNHVESLTRSLSSLTQLDKLSICVLEEMPGLWVALRGLNIKKLSLSGFLRVNNVELLSNSLSSLTQLKTLIIIVEKDSPVLLEALSGLNIRNLSVIDK